MTEYTVTTTCPCVLSFEKLSWVYPLLEKETGSCDKLEEEVRRLAAQLKKIENGDEISGWMKAIFRLGKDKRETPQANYSHWKSLDGQQKEKVRYSSPPLHRGFLLSVKLFCSIG